jgi:hypothetical protein
MSHTKPYYARQTGRGTADAVYSPDDAVVRNFVEGARR